MFKKPGQQLPPAVSLVFLSRKSVSLSRIDHHTHCPAKILQRPIGYGRLRKRADWVLVPVEQQKRSLNIRQMLEDIRPSRSGFDRPRQGGYIFVLISKIPGLKGHPSVAHKPEQGDSCLESVRDGKGAEGHISTVRAAEYPDPISRGNPLSLAMVDSPQNVIQIPFSLTSDIGLQECVTKSLRAPECGIEYPVTRPQQGQKACG